MTEWACMDRAMLLPAALCPGALAPMKSDGGCMVPQLALDQSHAEFPEAQCMSCQLLGLKPWKAS